MTMPPSDDQLADRRDVLAALNDAARRAIAASRRGDRDAWAKADADWAAAIERGHAICGKRAPRRVSAETPETYHAISRATP